jgi:hypothetical protein
LNTYLKRLFFGFEGGVQGEFDGLSLAMGIKSELYGSCEVYAFSFRSVNQPIPINAYALSVWTGEIQGW